MLNISQVLVKVQKYAAHIQTQYFITAAKVKAMQSVRFVIPSFCPSAGLLQSNQPISLKLSVMMGPTNQKHLLTFGVIRSQIRIVDHFSTSLAIAEWGILGIH